MDAPPPRRPRETLAERSARSGLGKPPPGPSLPKHCWVDGDPRWPGRRAALLLAWVRQDDGWHGRVALVPGEGVDVLVALVPALHLGTA